MTELLPKNLQIIACRIELAGLGKQNWMTKTKGRKMDHATTTEPFL
jgi:hypothetical protein